MTNKTLGLNCYSCSGIADICASSSSSSSSLLSSTTCGSGYDRCLVILFYFIVFKSKWNLISIWFNFKTLSATSTTSGFSAQTIYYLGCYTSVACNTLGSSSFANLINNYPGYTFSNWNSKCCSTNLCNGSVSSFSMNKSLIAFGFLMIFNLLRFH